MTVAVSNLIAASGMKMFAEVCWRNMVEFLVRNMQQRKITKKTIADFSEQELHVFLNQQQTGLMLAFGDI